MPKIVDFQDFQGFLIASFMAYRPSHGGSWELCQWLCAVIGLFVEGRMGWMVNHSISFQYISTQMRFELSWHKTERPSNSRDLCTDFGSKIYLSTMWGWFWKIPTNSGQTIQIFNPDIMLKHWRSLSRPILNPIHHWIFCGPGMGRPWFFHEKYSGGHLKKNKLNKVSTVYCR